MTEVLANNSSSTAQLSDHADSRDENLDLRVAVVHDYLTQRGGAERVVLALLEAFPGARLITSIYNPASTYPEFRGYEIETLWTNRIPAFQRDPRLALPVLPAAFESTVIKDVDVVICSSSGWSHGIPTAAPKLVYCHNPARWIYQTAEYLGGVPKLLHPVVRGLLPPLRRWDQRSAGGANQYVANSSVVRERVRRAYGRDAKVVHPPVMIDPQGPFSPVGGVNPGFLLAVGRQRGYKNVYQLCEGVARLGDERLVVIGGLPERADGKAWPDNIRGLVDVPDEQMRWLYANCVALVAVGHEDFGLTPLEANAFGRPAIVLRAGGYVDSTIDDVTGIFIEEPTTEQMQEAVRRLRETEPQPGVLQNHADRYSERHFAGAIRSEALSLIEQSDFPAPTRREEGEEAKEGDRE